jgi:3-phenylpropionate/trans-cinnamate dioxygenase ferredoxin reductase component
MSHLTSTRRRRAGVVIAGGGLAAQRASETLRRDGYDGAIRVIAREPHAPYDRPPLSKEFLAGEVDERALEFRPQPWYAEHDVELLLGERAGGLDAPGREVLLAGGGRLPFEQLLIATGSAPRRLPGTERHENVYELRTQADARALREALSTRPRLVVIGAGFIGQEVAATAKRLGASVTIIEAAPTPLGAILGPQLGEWFADFHRREGIELVLSARIARLHGARAVHAVELQHRRRIECDLLVVGIGTEPATSWLRDSGLDQAGVRVDAAGRTAIPSIFAAGDASAQFEPRRSAHVRTEHWEAAARQGASAARAMLGLQTPAAAPPSFWSDQHGVRIQFVGDTHGADRLEIDGQPAARDFTALFTHNDRPVAALLVGRPRALPELRQRIHDAASINHHERNAA